ncbi:aurora kinase B-like [Oratosquilla oratoria]|uniref:aurora kinase B-like n=1 Tax=Oratosquilla oratoria TaxID=337810 RepID=UPI003F75CFAB
MIFLVFFAICRCFQALSHSRKEKSSRGDDVNQTSNFATKPIDLTEYEEVLKCNEEALKRCNFTSGWRRVRVLGKGGFGKVFLLENKKLKKRIARKVVLSQPSKRGFTFEEMIQIQLSHPNVLRLFCWEQKMRTLSLNLEYCSKGNLTTNMPYLSENELKFYFEQLLDGHQAPYGSQEGGPASAAKARSICTRAGNDERKRGSHTSRKKGESGKRE